MYVSFTDELSGDSISSILYFSFHLIITCLLDSELILQGEIISWSRELIIATKLLQRFGDDCQTKSLPL